MDWFILHHKGGENTPGSNLSKSLLIYIALTKQEKHAAQPMEGKQDNLDWWILHWHSVVWRTVNPLYKLFASSANPTAYIYSYLSAFFIPNFIKILLPT